MDLDRENSFRFGKLKIIDTLLIVVIIALSFFLLNKYGYLKNNKLLQQKVESKPLEYNEAPKLAINIEGAVVNPGVYYHTSDKRVQDVILSAGGFTKEVDIDYVSKNINKAQKVTDGMKIYIPFKDEAIVEMSSSQIQSTGSSLVSINSATKSQLDELPGVGEVTADKIIKSRPYSNLDELKSKKVLTQSQFEKVAELISL